MDEQLMKKMQMITSEEQAYLDEEPHVKKEIYTKKNEFEVDSQLFLREGKLITVRQSHQALQSKGEIQFVHAKEKTYPFAYMRSSNEEKILVVINPSNREESFAFDKKLGKAVYTLGGKVEFTDGIVKVPGCTVGFFEL